MSWYRTGTVAVTNGSKTVTGVGTLFTTAVNVGDAFALVDANLNPTGAWYEVEAVVSNAEITLKQSYAGTTGSNNQYCVFNMVGNMTTPSFAQRLATFFASFQSLIDKPTVTPTAASIPVADSGGKIADGWIPAKYFNKTNILGTVSQSGGVPTGAVIESGSNANGSYVKFADGTMVCTQYISLANNGLSFTRNADSSNWYTTKDLTFPAEFSENPKGLSASIKSGAGLGWASVRVAETDSIQISVYDDINRSGDTLMCSYTAIGRWF